MVGGSVPLAQWATLSGPQWAYSRGGVRLRSPTRHRLKVNTQLIFRGETEQLSVVGELQVQNRVSPGQDEWRVFEETL